MPIAIGKEDGGGVTTLPVAPPPPPVASAPPPPPVASAPQPPSSPFTIAGGLDPAIATAIAARPPTPAAPATPASPSGGGGGTSGGGIDVPPDHRGLPQPGDLPGDVGPIVQPHGAPSPSASGSGGSSGGGGGGTTTDDSGGRTLTDAYSGEAYPAGDHRAEAATAWLHFQQFFSGELPHLATQVTALRHSIPKGVG